jgi:diaminopropionate ammonia-lyase
VNRFYVNEAAMRGALEPAAPGVRVPSPRGSGEPADPGAPAQAAPAPPAPDSLLFHRTMPGYEPTPLVRTPELADQLGIASLVVKDQSRCFGLPAFKIIGASWAVNCAVSGLLGLPPADTFAALAERAQSLRPLKLVTATDGNHGRAVAHMAALLGLDATIYVPGGTVPARIDAIRSEGARLEVVDGPYDDAVARAAQDAGPRCLIVSDTSWPGYESTPRAVIAGYATIMHEIDEQLGAIGAPQPDVVLVQNGVGALAAAVGAHSGGGHAPLLVSVEPDDTACMLESLAAGRIVTVPGPHRSIMAGLNCGTLSMVAWPVLQRTFQLCITVDDDRARRAMRMLADAGIESGESGASGLAGLLALCEAPEFAEPRSRFGIGPDTNVLVFSTEGATDPAAYAAIVGHPPHR